jgi:hypothetical protein
MTPMKEAYLLLPSKAVQKAEQSAVTREVVVLFDRVAGPYAAILKVRGSGSEIQELANQVGVAARDVCWLTEVRVRGGDAST